MSTDRPQDREPPKAFRDDDDKTLPSPVIRGATGLALATGRVLDERYTLVERIGAGGWGEVVRRDLAENTVSSHKNPGCWRLLNTAATFENAPR